MSIDNIIRDLSGKDIRLWLEGDVLRYDAPAGGLDPETRAMVVARKAEIVEFLRKLAEDDRHTAMPRCPAGTRIPLSTNQERLWFLFKMEGPSSVYNVVSSIELDHALSMVDYRRIVTEVIARHETLRVRFAEDETGAPYSVVEPEIALSIPLIDLSAIADPQARANEIRRLVVEEETRLFDLSSGPLAAASLIRLPGDACVVVLNFHHIAVDAWSMGIIGKEMERMVRAVRDRAPTSVAPIDYQYADFAYWQTQEIARGGFDGQLSYWQNKLQGLQPLLEMPTDFPRPERQRFKGLTEKMLLSADVGNAMQALCRKQGATLFMGLLTAFDVLVARYSGREDIVVGTALSGRTHPDMHGTVGMFTNTVALRNRIGARRSFLSLLDQVRETTLEAQANQDVPFRLVVEKTVGSRSLSHTPLYQVSFALNNAAEGVVNALISRNETQYSDNDGVLSTTVKDDLSLQVRVLPQHLELKLSYDTALFKRETALRMLAHYRTLLQSILAAPDAPVGELAMIDAAERDALLAWGENVMPGYPSEAGIHELFAAHCRTAPDAIAVQHDGFQLSYRALDRWSDGLAARLRASGAGLGDRVGLCVKRTPEIVAGMLAILKIGASYVPLDRSYPQQVVDHMIQDSQVRLILNDSDETPWSQDALSLRFSREDALEHIARDENAAAVAGGGDLPAYVNYTSGSTGTPKGVEVNHRNVVRLVRGTDYVQLGAEDVFGQISNHSFDAFTFEVWGSLLNGGRLVHVDRDDLLEPARFGKFVADNKVSTMFITVSLFGHVVHLCPTALQTVRNVLFGGDVVNIDALRRIDEQGRPKRLINAYGPTENTTFSTAFEYTDSAQFPHCIIGGPIGNSSAHILDPDLNLVPVGVAGELYVGGDGVAIGYVRRPEQTAERFVPDPFSKTPGARMYRTGDRVMRNAEGQIVFLGRLDNQVKIRGFRIETGEIEVRLSAHPEVREAAVLVDVAADGDKRLIAYVAADDDGGLVERITRYMKQELPDYKQPFAYIVLDKIPLTHNGKIDRARLPAAGIERKRSVLAPRDAMEKAIAEIWCELLGREQVSADDDFFELGGHSLLAITASVRLKDQLGAEVGTRDIFEHPVLADLAQFVRERPRSQVSELPPLVAASRRERAVPSFAQQRLWFVEQIEGPSAVYHMPMVMRLDRRFGEDAIRNALEALQRRHESLRTAFSEVNGIPRAVVAQEAELPIRVVDVSRFAAGGPRAIEQRCQKLIGEDVETPFDLAQAPLYRALLLRLPEGEHVLAVTFHHVICDGWSLGILQREFAALLEDANATLPDIPFQYGDYAHWYRGWLESGALKPHIEHWRDRLQGVPEVLSLRPGEPRPEERRQEGRTIEVVLEESLVAGLESVAKTQGCTLFMAMLAGFKVLLARHSGQSEIVVGTPAANRPLAELEGMVGLFVNMLPLRTHVDANECFSKLLKRVRETTLDAYEHQGVPFEQLVDALGLSRNLSYAPLIQIAFVNENFVADTEATAGIEPMSLRGFNRTSKFDINVGFERLRDGGRFYFEYDLDLYSYGFARGLIDEYRTLLEACVVDPEVGLAAFMAPPASAAGLPAIAAVEQEDAAPLREAPKTPTERALAAIWSGLLEGQSIMRDDNFFALGGHSLLASQACATINAQFGTDLRIRAFYACKDLRALAEAVDAERKVEQSLDEIDLDAMSEEEAERMLAALQASGAQA